MLDLTVVTPTVDARRGIRDATLDQWRAIGYEPLVVEQSPPYGHERQTTTALTALHLGLDTGAGWIVYAEDDIDLLPALPAALPTLLLDVPVFLWPRPWMIEPGTVGVAPCRHPARYWGSQCIVMPRHVAQFVTEYPGMRHGIDLRIRETLAANRIRMHVHNPPLVTHRDLPRIASRGGPIR